VSGYYGPPVLLPRCKHGYVTAFDGCPTCDEERETARIAEERRVQAPARVILDAIAARRRWFDLCAFCSPSEDALYAELRHAPGCPWVTALKTSEGRDG
jgi:hypothetical protein